MERFVRHALVKLVQFCLGMLIGHICLNLYSPVPVRVHRVNPATHMQFSAAPESLAPVFVGVMTARKYLNSRGCSAWRSWASDLVKLGGEVKFFIGSSDSGAPVSDCGLNLVVLKGVPDDDYPPQRKSFAMFKWMEENHGNTSYWFMRTDDDVYVNGERLLKFLGGIDHSELHFLGQAGRGRGKEEGHLSLLWNQNFCMGGTGMILSQTTLKTFVPKIETCLTNLLTNHEDVEVGRCVTMATGQSCTWAYEMQNLFFHSAGGKDERGLEIQPDSINHNILNNAITIHPVKSPRNMEMLSVRYKFKKRLQILTRLQNLIFDINKLEQNTNIDIDNLDDLPKVDSTWDFVYGHNLYSAASGREKTKVPSRLNRALTKIISQVVEKINKDAREKGRTIEFRDLYYAYVNHDPKYGNTFILDILLVYKKFQGKKMTIKVRRHVFARQLLLDAHTKHQSGAEYLPSPIPAVVPVDSPSYYEDDRRTITILFTVAGDNKIIALKRFFVDFEREVLLKMNPVKLVVVVYKENSQDDGITNLLKNRVEYLEKEYPGFSVIKVIEENGRFSRGVGLMKGMTSCKDSDLIFIIDVDISFNTKALENVRRFTVEEKSVYFPIVFSEFRDGGGYWRDFGYGIMSGFKKDIMTVGGYKTDIVGWGKEDVDLYDKIMRSKLYVYRSIDSNLVHKYHKVTCSISLPAEQGTMCAVSRANTFLPINTLFNLVVNSSLITP